MPDFERENLKALCLIIYECVGKSDEDFLESGLVRMGLALGQNRVRDNRTMVRAMASLVDRARKAADGVMGLLEPDAQRAVLERANALLAAYNKGREPLTDQAMKAALECVGLIDDNDLDILRVKRLINLAIDPRTPRPEALAAASAACATITDRGLMLGPRRATTKEKT